MLGRGRAWQPDSCSCCASRDGCGATHNLTCSSPCAHTTWHHSAKESCTRPLAGRAPTNGGCATCFPFQITSSFSLTALPKRTARAGAERRPARRTGPAGRAASAHRGGHVAKNKLSTLLRGCAAACASPLVRRFLQCSRSWHSRLVLLYEWIAARRPMPSQSCTLLSEGGM